jgi:TDG/mug DNA glycosylase family protein
MGVTKRYDRQRGHRILDRLGNAGGCCCDTCRTRGSSLAALEQIVARRLPDLIAPDLSVLFCGINPGLYSAAVGHHFARPGNRFWPALHAGGFTGRLLSPYEDRSLLESGYGLTNLVSRATAGADELSAAELIAGVKLLERKIRRHQPRWIAILGIGAYRTAFVRPRAALGEQAETLAGAKIWVLPNPSGLNAHHQPKQLAAAFSQLRAEARSPFLNPNSMRR